MNKQYRKATKADAELIALLAVKMWTSHTPGKLASGFTAATKNENSVVYLLTVDKVIVGFAQCGRRHDCVEGTSSSPVGYLEGIFVEEKYRKQGYAKQLLNCCEQWAKKKDVLNLQATVNLIMKSSAPIIFCVKTIPSSNNKNVDFNKSVLLICPLSTMIPVRATFLHKILLGAKRICVHDLHHSHTSLCMN